MVFNSGFTRAEIEALTIRELFEYAERFYELENERMFNFFKAFCIYNCESTALAFSGKAGDFRNYVKEVSKRTLELTENEETISEQFEKTHGK